MSAGRFEIFVAIEKERDYQDAKWGGLEHDRQHGVADWLLMMEQRLAAAKHGGPQEGLDELRKVAAMAVACMEAHGLVPRAIRLDDE